MTAKPMTSPQMRTSQMSTKSNIVFRSLQLTSGFTLLMFMMTFVRKVVPWIYLISLNRVSQGSKNVLYCKFDI